MRKPRLTAIDPLARLGQSKASMGLGDHGGDASIGPGTDIQVFQRMMAAIEAASVIRRLGGTGR